MSRKWAVLLICVIAPLLAGCWDAREPNDRAYVTVVGIDKDGVCYAVADVSKAKESPGAEAFIRGGADGKRLYLGQVKAVIMSRAVADDPAMLRRAVDMLEAGEEINGGVPVVTAKSAADAIDPKKNGEKPVGVRVENRYKNENYQHEKVELETLARKVREGGVIVLPEMADDQ